MKSPLNTIIKLQSVKKSVKKPINKLQILTPNNIKFLDCFKFLKTIDNKSIDLILIDPPYFNVMIKDWKNNKIDWDTKWKNIHKYSKWCLKWIKECKRVLKDSGSLYIFADAKNQAYIQCKTDKFFKLKNVIYWVKPNSLQKKGWHQKYHYSPITENILYYSNMYDLDKKTFQFKYKISNYINQWFVNNKLIQKEISKLFPSKTGGITGCISNWRKGLNLITKKQYQKIQHYANKHNLKGLERDWQSFVNTFNQLHNFTNVWNSNMTQTCEKTYGHPTQKPIAVLERIINTSSKKNDIVLDFFMGSGSTAVAALKNNRFFQGCDNVKKYYDMTIQRIKKIDNF